MTLPARYDPAVAEEPRERALDLLVLPIRCHIEDRWAASPRLPCLRTPPQRDRVPDAALREIAPERSAVVAPVSGQPPWSGASAAPTASHAHSGERGLGQADLTLLCTLDEQADRQPLTVGDEQELGALPFARLAYAKASLLAGTKLPLRNASAQRSLLSASCEARNVCQRRSQVPSASQRWSLRHAVDGWKPYSAGRSQERHAPRQPERMTKRMASSTTRSSARGRPILFGGGGWGRMASHCALERRGMFMFRSYRVLHICNCLQTVA